MTETPKTTPLEIIKDNGRDALLWLLSLEVITQTINLLGAKKEFTDSGSFILIDKKTGENIGQGWQKTGAPSGNVLSQNYFNQDSTLLQTIRQKLKP